MKKMKLLILIILFSLKAFAPSERVMYIPEGTGFNPYERYVRAVTWVESQGDTWAINVHEQAVGPFQIRPIRVDHYNRLLGTDYKTWDFFDYDLSRDMFLYFADRYGPYNIDLAVKRWNGSGRMTIDYLKRVKAKL